MLLSDVNFEIEIDRPLKFCFYFFNTMKNLTHNSNHLKHVFTKKISINDDNQ